MPIYEFKCNDCGKITSVFVRKMASELEAPCQHCQSQNTRRMISTVARLKTEQDVLEEYGTPGEDARPGDEYRDPRQIGRWVEKKFDEYGMDLPKEARDMIDAAREGDFPEPVKDL